MWDKDLNPLTYSTDVMDPSHSWESFFESKSWTGNFGFFLWGILFTFFYNFGQDILEVALAYTCWDFKGFGEFDIVEDMSSYHHYIKGDNKNWYVNEYEYAKDKLLMDFDNDQIIKEIKD